MKKTIEVEVDFYPYVGDKGDLEVSCFFDERDTEEFSLKGILKEAMDNYIEMNSCSPNGVRHIEVTEELVAFKERLLEIVSTIDKIQEAE
jgi:hypothetical protein